MLYKKFIKYPKTSARKLRFSGCSLFRERNEMLIAEHSLHFRPTGNVLVCGEGGKEVISPPAVTRLYAEGKNLLLYGGGTLYRLSGTFAAVGNVAEPNGAAVYNTQSGEEKTYLVTADGVYCAEYRGVRMVRVGGASCCAVHYERLFTASGFRVRWSRALAPEDWTESPQGAGYVDLPSDGGNIVALIPYKEKLYLFRERGISQLRVLGDNLNFKAVEMPFACGNIAPLSVVNCGERILFITENGLYAFNGGVCARLKGSGSHLWESVSQAAFRGSRYYACIKTKTAGIRLFSYDCEEETGYFMRARAQSVACCRETYYVEDGTLFRVTPCGFSPLDRFECTLKTELSSFGLSYGMKYLDGIALGGKGYFRIRAENERGEGCAVYGKAGEELRFPCPVRGTAFCLKIYAYTESARLGEIAVALREEG